MLALLRHLESVGFAAAPRVIEPGVDEQGRETLSYIEGGIVHPGAWPTDDALFAVGKMLKDLHDATADFHPPENTVWQRWFARDLGKPTVFGHGEPAPWNIIARDGMPVALVDWETAGPLDPMTEVAHAAWLNAQLHDVDVTELNDVPDLGTRARHLRALSDGYGLSRAGRSDLFDAMVEFAVHSAAWEAIEASVTPDGGRPQGAWAMAWRIRGAAMMLRNRDLLEQALA